MNWSVRASYHTDRPVCPGEFTEISPGITPASGRCQSGGNARKQRRTQAVGHGPLLLPEVRTPPRGARGWPVSTQPVRFHQALRCSILDATLHREEQPRARIPLPFN
jgi:hypothetical protein